jgi:glycosyltransferase involved in cell wall biosynthesis
MTRKSVLIVNYEFPPLGGGGGHASAHVARSFASWGWDVRVMTSRFTGLPAFEEREGVAIHRIPTWRRHREKCSVSEMAAFLVSSLWHVFKMCRQKRPELVISFFSIPSGPAAFLARLAFGVPYVIALRGADVPGFLPEQLAFFHGVTNWLTRIMWRHAAAVTANSIGLAELARKFFDRPVPVIPNGVGDNFFREVLAARPAVNLKDPLKLLTVSRLSLQKRVERQIEGLVRLKENGFDAVELTIVGDGPERSRLQSLVERAGLNDRVRFIGWCEREELVRHYHGSDAFLMTSDYEGMPNVILEAMASSLAIVAVDAPGTSELVRTGTNGVLVGHGDSAGLDLAIRSLADDPQALFRMQRQSYGMAKARTWDGVARAFERLALDALGDTEKAASAA